MGPLGGESAVVSSKASLTMKFEVLRNNLQAMKEGTGMKERLALDRGMPNFEGCDEGYFNRKT